MDADFTRRVLELMGSRRSCRRYLAKDIDDDVLRGILAAGLRGPSGGNLQPYSIVVVRNAQTRALIAELCGQTFIKEAPMHLVFLLDWHKLSLYASSQRAPFLSNQSLDDNLTAYADLVCAMERVETAALLYGLGACFIGNGLGKAGPLREALGLRDKTYPVLIMTLGYPAGESAEPPKLPYDCMVFYERCDSVPDDRLREGFEEKYGGMRYDLPAGREQRSRQLAQIRAALEAAYPPDDALAILAQIEQSGGMNETQRRFTLQYRANESRVRSDAVRKDMEAFDIWM